MWDNVSYQKRETNVRVMVEGDRRIPHLTGIMFWKRQKVWQIQNSQGDFNIYLLCPFINADFSFFPQCPHFQCPSLFPTKDLLITQKGFSSESCEAACSLLFSWWLVPSYRLYSRLLWRYAALPILHSKPTELSSLALSIWIPCPFVLIPLWIPSQISVRMCLLHICAVSPSTVGEDCTITVQRAIANPWSPTLASPLALPKPLPFSDYSKKKLPNSIAVPKHLILSRQPHRTQDHQAQISQVLLWVLPWHSWPGLGVLRLNINNFTEHQYRTRPPCSRERSRQKEYLSLSCLNTDKIWAVFKPQKWITVPLSQLMWGATAPLWVTTSSLL